MERELVKGRVAREEENATRVREEWSLPRGVLQGE